MHVHRKRPKPVKFFVMVKRWRKVAKTAINESPKHNFGNSNGF